MSTNIPQISTPLKQDIITECQKRLKVINKVTLESVSKTDNSTREFLRENSPIRLKELAQLNCFAANKIKQELDKKYGENNYVLIALGRSISSIAELMKQMGVETKIIPLSGLRRGDVDNISAEKLHMYKTFLVQIGLSKTDLKQNGDKKYILTDYTHYGTSLEKAYKLLKRYELLGDAENLIMTPVSELLGSDYTQKGYMRLFEYCRFKDYSYVASLNPNELDKVYERCSPDRIKEFKGNITQGIRNLFWFNVYDSLINGNYNNIAPIKELNAIYNHYLSAKAVHNYLKKAMKMQAAVCEILKNIK